MVYLSVFRFIQLATVYLRFVLDSNRVLLNHTHTLISVVFSSNVEETSASSVHADALLAPPVPILVRVSRYARFPPAPIVPSQNQCATFVPFPIARVCPCVLAFLLRFLVHLDASAVLDKT